ncbi:Bax inhibitor-1/YccA family protein [Actinomyces faecalis]|uniref:Bax inhibitor-1/YccA family protein n=1 Tax=Actinomyces faecalis TaxID=2722820 RepID=UPI0015518140|nr:Bax inhibitor-1/YccA family protein [Actinomyces faecalis]
MSNPYFDRSPAFKEGGTAVVERTPNGYPAMPGYQPGSAGSTTAAGRYGAGTDQQAPGYGQVSPEQVSGLEQQYAAPSATNVDRGRMTYDDVIVRTGAMFAVILALGAVSWNLATSPATSAAGMMAMVAGALGALVLGLVNSFKREPSPVLILAYAACEGVMLGAFSGVMELAYPGIVLQAVLGTLAVFAVMLAAYKVGGFRVSGKAARILVLAMGGYLVFSLVNFLLMVTGTVTDPWGLRGMTVAGIPLGLIVGALAVVMAAFSLAMDFESIQRGVERGLPTRYAWAGAFGLTVTLVWLYVEILRILVILRGDD